jgi:hypothetical protein
VSRQVHDDDGDITFHEATRLTADSVHRTEYTATLPRCPRTRRTAARPGHSHPGHDDTGAPDTGTFRIRAELIGFRTEHANWFRADGTTAHALRLVSSEQAISLAAIPGAVSQAQLKV